MYSPELIKSQLDRLQQLKSAKGVNPTKPPVWTDFQPQQLSYQRPAGQQDMYSQLQNQIMANDQEVTATAMVKAQNQFNYNQMKNAQQGLKTAHQQFVKPLPPGSPSEGGIPTGGNANPVNWGKDRIPEVSDIKNLNPNAALRTMEFRGMSYTVNSQVAPIFQAFLKDLWRMGYHPKSIGGYSDRNIAGTNTPSLHSYGFAIDIDPSLNPVTYNGQTVTKLPASVGALAAKYGLSWGGAWTGSKRDSMHFSVAYGGVK